MKRRLTSLLIAACAILSLQAAKQPKYVFYFIGDGMGMGSVMATQLYNRMMNEPQEKLLMSTFPVASFATTYSASNPITDSAAAGTALATGKKTRNGMIGVTPDSVAVNSIATELKKRGYGVGITTSVALNDATPAAFYGHAPHRTHFDKISSQLPLSNFDFFSGAVLRNQKEDVTKMVTDGGYTLCFGIEDYKANGQKGKTVLLDHKLNDMHQIGYTVDNVQGHLTLPEITRTAIAHLQKNTPGKFFLMVEGGNIDWAAHANDPGAVIQEVKKFNEALREAYNFYLKHKDETLIVVTADHDTGGMAIGQRGYDADFTPASLQKTSISELNAACTELLKSGKAVSWEDFKQLVSDKTGLFTKIPVTAGEASKLKSLYEDVFVNRDNKEIKTLYASVSTPVNYIFDLLNWKNNIGWTTTSHTGNFVPVFAIGAGSEAFLGQLDNTEIPMKILKLAK